MAETEWLQLSAWVKVDPKKLPSPQALVEALASLGIEAVDTPSIRRPSL